MSDPWIYNEYIDHSRLPEDFENMQAAKNLVSLLLAGGEKLIVQTNIRSCGWKPAVMKNLRFIFFFEPEH
ncbi:MAG: hypothetical protein AAGU19_12390 [Prolixibacteraceae bacterium]